MGWCFCCCCSFLAFIGHIIITFARCCSFGVCSQCAVHRSQDPRMLPDSHGVAQLPPLLSRLLLPKNKSGQLGTRRNDTWVPSCITRPLWEILLGRVIPHNINVWMMKEHATEGKRHTISHAHTVVPSYMEFTAIWGHTLRTWLHVNQGHELTLSSLRSIFLFICRVRERLIYKIHVRAFLQISVIHLYLNFMPNSTP